MSISRVSEVEGRPSGAVGALRGVVSNRGFVSCAVLLTAMAIAFQVQVIRANIQFNKLPLPLKKPLTDLNQNKLRPYKVMRVMEINEQTLDALGTREYIQWILEDTRVAAGRPERYVSLFVTYYTGKPDQVPHVPEVCEGATGAEVASEIVEMFEIPALGEGVTIPVKVLEFENSRLLRSKGTQITMYTFSANGEFKSGRRGVQLRVSDTSARHAYFSKVEVRVGGQSVYPDRATAIAAGKAFLQVIVPILVEDHWPDWEAAELDTRS